MSITIALVVVTVGFVGSLIWWALRFMRLFGVLRRARVGPLIMTPGALFDETNFEPDARPILASLRRHIAIGFVIGIALGASILASAFVPVR